jgi:hypothetical protein
VDLGIEGTRHGDGIDGYLDVPEYCPKKSKTQPGNSVRTLGPGRATTAANKTSLGSVAVVLAFSMDCKFLLACNFTRQVILKLFDQQFLS